MRLRVVFPRGDLGYWGKGSGEVGAEAFPQLENQGPELEVGSSGFTKRERG